MVLADERRPTTSAICLRKAPGRLSASGSSDGPNGLAVAHLDVTDTTEIRQVVNKAFADLGKIDVVINNAGYGLFGAAEELSNEKILHQIDTNLIGSIQLVRASLPHLRKQGGGRIIQLSTYGGQATHPGASLYHASKWGIEGFMESVMKEVAPCNIGITLVEPGGARTNFRFGSSQLAQRMAAYDGTPASNDSRNLGCIAPFTRRSCEDGEDNHRERRAESSTEQNRPG